MYSMTFNRDKCDVDEVYKRPTQETQDPMMVIS